MLWNWKFQFSNGAQPGEFLKTQLNANNDADAIGLQTTDSKGLNPGLGHPDIRAMASATITTVHVVRSAVGRVACDLLRKTLSWLMPALVLLLIAAAVSPQIHRALHHEADAAGHECVVTLVAQGQWEAPALPITAPLPEFAEVSTSVPVQTVYLSVPSSLLSARGPPGVA